MKQWCAKKCCQRGTWALIRKAYDSNTYFGFQNCYKQLGGSGNGEVNNPSATRLKSFGVMRPHARSLFYVMVGFPMEAKVIVRISEAVKGTWTCTRAMHRKHGTPSQQKACRNGPTTFKPSNMYGNGTQLLPKPKASPPNGGVDTRRASLGKCMVSLSIKWINAYVFYL